MSSYSAPLSTTSALPMALAPPTGVLGLSAPPISPPDSTMPVAATTHLLGSKSASSATAARAKQPRGAGHRMFQHMFSLLKQMLPPEQYAALRSEMRNGNGKDIKSVVAIVKRIVGDTIFACVIQKMDLTRNHSAVAGSLRITAESSGTGGGVVPAVSAVPVVARSSMPMGQRPQLPTQVPAAEMSVALTQSTSAMPTMTQPPLSAPVVTSAVSQPPEPAAQRPTLVDATPPASVTNSIEAEPIGATISTPPLSSVSTTVAPTTTPASAAGDGADGAGTNDTQDKIQFAKKLVSHVSTCTLPPRICQVKRCDDVQRAFKHTVSCGDVRDCSHCKQLKTLVEYHAKECLVPVGEHCKIPLCDPIRHNNVAARARAVSAGSSASSTPTSTTTNAAAPTATPVPSSTETQKARTTPSSTVGVLSDDDEDNTPLASAVTNSKKRPKTKSPRVSPYRSMGKANLARGMGRVADIVMQRGQGSYIWTADQRKLLDFTSGNAVTNLGHCHPRVVAATQKQVATLVHGQVNIGYHAPMLELVDRLLPVMPKGLDSLFFAASGSEAVENAIKLACHATRKQNVIVFQGGYHGRTFAAISLTTGKGIYSTGFGSMVMVSGVKVVPFPDSIHGPIYDQKQMDDWCLEQVELALMQQSAPSDTAAILLEPILGEGGCVVPTKKFLKGLRRICDGNGILLIADEVQSGFGRTGEFFAIDGHFDVVPDILVMAEGIANGFPLSGFASRKELADTQPPGSMGGTYAGNAVSCAAAIAVLDVMQEENILENTRARGAQLMAGLLRLKNSGRYPIADVRGLGLMVAMEFDAKQVSAGTASHVSQACLHHGMMVLTTSVYETLRLMPPLTISKDETELGLELLKKALEDTFQKQK